MPRIRLQSLNFMVICFIFRNKKHCHFCRLFSIVLQWHWKVDFFLIPSKNTRGSRNSLKTSELCYDFTFFIDLCDKVILRLKWKHNHMLNKYWKYGEYDILLSILKEVIIFWFALPNKGHHALENRRCLINGNWKND